MKRIGIFAGTFDPIHQGHIAFCLAALQQCDLGKIYLLPERTPRAKYNVSDIARRVEIIRQETRSLPQLEVALFDDAQFSVEHTLPTLQQKFSNTHLTFLIGSDIACHSLAKWQNLDILAAVADFAVGVRGDSSIEEVENAMQNIAKQHRALRYTVISSPHAHVSSSQIRSRATM